MNRILANWAAPSNISAITTLRTEGISQDPYASNNLALHVGDNEEMVKSNRQSLRDSLKLPAEPIWLTQTHGIDCIIPEEDDNRIADAAVTRQAHYPLAIMTADCLPILLCDVHGKEIAAIHAGWRGLAAGIIESTLLKMHTLPSDVIAWLGPTICEKCFEVGDDVFQTFLARYPYAINVFHKQDSKWRMDLSQMAADILKSLGILAVSQAKRCTYEQKNYFYSYRRESQTGRMASLIWFNTKNRT